MGGAQDVWQEAEHPWLRSEKQAIRKAVLEYQMPYLGICLGHQLLAAALGGEVQTGDEPRGRRVRGRADRGRARASAVRRAGADDPLRAVACGRGHHTACGRHRACLLERLRGAGAGGRRARVRPAVPCRGRRADARRLAVRSRDDRSPDPAPGRGRRCPLPGRGTRPDARSQCGGPADLCQLRRAARTRLRKLAYAGGSRSPR